MLGRLKGKRMGLELVKDYDSCVVNSLLPDLSCWKKFLGADCSSVFRCFCWIVSAAIHSMCKQLPFRNLRWSKLNLKSNKAMLLSCISVEHKFSLIFCFRCSRTGWCWGGDLLRRPLRKALRRSDFFFWLFALDSTLIKIVYHKLHWSTRLRLRGFVWHVQGCRRRATQEGGDEDMLRQSAEEVGSVI